MLGDGTCNSHCFVRECGYDSDGYVGDCANFCDPACGLNMIGNGTCEMQCYNAACRYDDGDCEGIIDSFYPGYPNWWECAPGCPRRLLQDGVCDEACQTSDCEWDAGD